VPRRASVRVASLPSLLAMTIAALGMVPCAWPAKAGGTDDEQHRARANAHMTEGDAHQAAGAHLEAARAYAKAFDAYAARSKRDAKETQAVSLAVDEFRLAQQEQPESLALLEEEAALLERFQAHAEHAGTMLDESSRLRTGIEALRREAQRHEDADAEQRRAARARSRRTMAILGSGVAGLAGGVALLGGGVWTFAAADRRRDDQRSALDANEYPNEADHRAALDEWYQRGRRIATGLVVSGAVLTGVGLGLTAWWAVRASQARGASKYRVSVIVPMLAPGRVGLATIVRF
jgi:hypothetical protein